MLLVHNSASARTSVSGASRQPVHTSNCDRRAVLHGHDSCSQVGMGKRSVNHCFPSSFVENCCSSRFRSERMFPTLSAYPISWISCWQGGRTMRVCSSPGSLDRSRNAYTSSACSLSVIWLLLPSVMPQTDRLMRSEIPYLILGAGYIYLLALSWTPETLGLMFSSKYWLPEVRNSPEHDCDAVRYEVEYRTCI